MLCDLGCGREAKYYSKELKKWRCEKYSSKCPEIKKKNKRSSTRAWKNKVRKQSTYNPAQNWWRDPNSKGFKRWVEYIKSHVFIKDKYSDSRNLSKLLINYLNWEYKCNICNLTVWNNKPIVLELDHIDGDKKNNTLSNLRLVCPNCHSQTPTFRGRNRNKQYIPDEEIIALIPQVKNIRQLLLKIGLTPKGGNYERIRHLVQKYALQFAAVVELADTRDFPEESALSETKEVERIKVGETSDNGNTEPSLLK